jgi:RNA polymerase sigma-B factor
LSQQIASRSVSATETSEVPVKLSIVTSFDEASDSNAAEAVRLLVDALSQGGHATELIRTDDQLRSDAELTSWACETRAGWTSRGAPDVIHAIGEAAVRATLDAAGGAVPVVATFLGEPEISASEKALARRCAGLLVLSAHEAHVWAGVGIPRDRIHVFHLPSATTEHTPGHRSADGYVVTDARGQALEAVLASMRAWSRPRHGPRLVALSTMKPTDLAVMARHANRHALDDVELRPGLRGEALSTVVGDASLAVATEPRRDGGLALEAGRHGVPSIVVDDNPLNELVVNGATGLVIPRPIGADTLAKAVRYLLSNQTALDGCGEGALRRVKAVHNAATAARQSVVAYAKATRTDGQDDTVATSGSSSRRRRSAIQQMTTTHLGLARQLAQRYAGRGQALEELVGVANLGLVKAAVRFDPEHGSAFPSYAVPTILGELRRYFRDHAWAVRVPRTLQEHALDVERTADDLRGVLGHDATPGQVADQLDISDRDVVAAQQTRHEALSSTSLDRPIGDEADGGVLGDLLGAEDGRFAAVEEAQAVREALQRLPEREREIVVMSFYGERTQEEIAERLGISQVHVSRTLARTLTTLRQHVLDEVPLPDSWRPPADDIGEASEAEPASAQV